MKTHDRAMSLGIGVALTATDLYGKQDIPLDDLWNDICEVDWRVWIEALIEINTLLYPNDYNSSQSEDLQIELMKKVIPPQYHLKVSELLRSRERVAICFPTQCEILQSLILGWGKEGKKDLSLELLTRALVAVNESIVGIHSLEKVSRSTLRKQTTASFLRLGLLQAEENFFQQVHRWFYLYLYAKDLHGKTLLEAYPNFSESIGMPINKWLMYAFGALALWEPRNRANGIYYDTSKALTSVSSFVESEFKAVLATVSADRKTFQEALQVNETPQPNPSLITLRTLAQFPILLNEHSHFAPLSIRRLVSQLLEAPFHKHLMKCHGPESEQFRSFWGYLFEDYVNWIISDSGCTGTIFRSPTYMFNGNNMQLSDLAIEINDCLILIEIKSSKFPNSVYQTGALSHGMGPVRKMFEDPVKQMNKRIFQWYQSSSDSLSKAPSSFKAVFPVLLFLQYIPSVALVNSAISSLVFMYSRSPSERVKNIEVISIQEFEFLVSGINRYDLCELFISRATETTEDRRHMSHLAYAQNCLGWKLSLPKSIRITEEVFRSWEVQFGFPSIPTLPL